ncbi:hypothetical protein PINS_up007246 [Pythium insidiosum]|nr:hypothetical protein PINS_up007246 [Pythium insidiosum]
MSADARECERLSREVEAFEQLVNRYQEELERPATCASCGSTTRRSPILIVEEEILEYQTLNPVDWTAASIPIDRPQYSRRDGEQCTFDSVELPHDWEWVGSWIFDVHAKTDSNGWTYASAWHDLDNWEHSHGDRTIEDRVRRRRWRRERQFVGSKSLPGVVIHRLRTDQQLTDMQRVNEKLTMQLQVAYSRICEYESRVRQYELKLQEMQNYLQTQPPISQAALVNGDEWIHSQSTKMANGESPPLSFIPTGNDDILEKILSGTPDLRDLDEETQEVHRRRSMMVLECQNELDNAVNEFRDLVSSLDRPTRR